MAGASSGEVAGVVDGIAVVAVVAELEAVAEDVGVANSPRSWRPTPD